MSDVAGIIRLHHGQETVAEVPFRHDYRDNPAAALVEMLKPYLSEWVFVSTGPNGPQARLSATVIGSGIGIRAEGSLADDDPMLIESAARLNLLPRAAEKLIGILRGGITCWRDEIEREMADHNDIGPIVEWTFADGEADIEFDSACGGGAAFTAWSNDRVYFPGTYDGAVWCTSVPRNPCNEATDRVGGG